MEKTIYTAPAAEVLEIATEGVLCGSGSTETYSYKKFDWGESQQ